MAVRWEVLASGSSGNASLLEVEDRRLLLDAGLPPRRLTQLLGEVGVDWSGLHAMLLTHTHSDHWHPGVLEQLVERRIPLFCHHSHRTTLQLNGPAFVPLALQGLVRYFESGKRFSPIAGVSCTPLPVPHDGGDTFGFRLEGTGHAARGEWAIAYAADLGSWDRTLAPAFANVDVLALEFNHDLDLQKASRRPPWLVARVLGNQGHLSNHQGARLLKECLAHSHPDRLAHVVQLHISKDCNRAELAAEAAHATLAELGVAARVHTTWQGVRGPSIQL